MKKRAVVFFSFLMLGMLISLLSLFTVANGEGYAQTAQRQSSYRLTVGNTRGAIYDCNLLPLTGKTQRTVAAVAPTVEGGAALSKVLTQDELSRVYSKLTAGKPFALVLPNKVKAQGITLFELENRYQDNQLAAHVVGYTDSSGKGLSGIEKAFDRQLSENQGSMSVTYRVDALGRVLAGEKATVSDTSHLGQSGVVLTLDSRIQTLAEQAARKYLKKGAVVITEISSGEIRAMVSLPAFHPNNPASSLKGKDSPMLNRALEAYSVGSVFKLVSASAALQYGVSPDTQFTCTGGIDVDGMDFHCYHGQAHGEEDMKAAIVNSCNSYFVNLMQQVPPAQFLLMAQSFGFGQITQLAPGYRAAAGILPTLELLKLPRALANFSFGQGTLTATPVQIAGLINAVANDGVYTPPTLYRGLADADRRLTEEAKAPESVPVLHNGIAAQLRSFMEASIDGGTSKRGKPDHLGAGAKTATAQTGRVTNGEEEIISWFAGYYPSENPKYGITIMAEGGLGGGTTCGPVFKEIANSLYDRGFVAPQRSKAS